MLRLWVTPKASRTQPEGQREGRLVLRVKAPPVEGKANAEVIRWAAETFGVRRSAVTLVRGEKSREKDLLLAGIDLSAAEGIVGRLLNG